ncbi:MAG: ABC transporter substrate-binding protein [Desulfobacter sp.]|nr:MAG: ABC transporter substrate-binding protein [Desulfobacter sp.]
MKRQFLFILFFCGLAAGLFCCTSAIGAMKVTFLNPDPPGSPFWTNMTRFMQSISDDLNIELQVFYGDRTRFENKSNFQRAISQPDKPDYIMTILQVGTAEYMLEAAEKAGVKIFVINTDIPEFFKNKIGTPRDKYSNWIGHMHPDDEKGGALLGETLYKKISARNLNPGPPFAMLGISGSYESSPAFYRNQGMETVINRYADIVQRQVVFAYWNKKKAYEITNVLLRRYPDISIIWCAGGAMTFGVIEAIEAQSDLYKSKLLFGTFDWGSDIVQLIKEGKIYASVGGHFLNGGWSLILLYDYHHGIDFKDEMGVTIQKPLSVITPDNVVRYESLLSTENWDSINFKEFTKTHRGRDFSYSFTIEALNK